MPIYVKNEIGKLNKVILHRPGKGPEHLVPGELERLLFDDIPYLRTTQSEHDLFAGILKEDGAEVVYLKDGMTEILKANPTVKESFVKQFINESGNTTQRFKDQLHEFPMGISDEKQLVLKTMSDVGIHELRPAFGSPLVSLVKSDSYFITDPIPNLHFTRDPFACTGNGVSLNCMYSGARRRETIFDKCILEYHPDHAGRTPFYYKREYPFSIKGGDILDLSRGVLTMGVSQRTTPEAVELLAQNIFEDESCKVGTILALGIPSIRTYMHLDTVCIQVDYDKFTIHPGVLGNLRIYEICRGDKSELPHVTELDQPLLMVLVTRLGLDKVTMIRCGGKDKVASEREQQNDRSNILCIRPGRVVVYDRNYTTNSILRDSGIEVLEVLNSEPSGDREGPRCISVPLEWEGIQVNIIII